MNLISQFVQILELKRYSANTISSYKSNLLFVEGATNKKLEKLTDKDILSLIHHLIQIKKCSASYQKGIVYSLKLFYKEIFNKDLQVDHLIPTRSEFKIPPVFSVSEVQQILGSLENLKHKAILQTIYGCGLRIGELINLKIEHIDSKRGLLHVENGKGKRDRSIPLPKSVLELLRQYYKEYKPGVYLFNGQGKEQYSQRSIQLVLKSAMKRARVFRKASVHTLRHSYATHLFEAGTDIRLIKELLGHKDIKTTLIYTHISKPHLNSIADRLDLILLNNSAAPIASPSAALTVSKEMILEMY